MAEVENALKAKRRHEQSSDTECVMQERIKRLRIGGGNPWCVQRPCLPLACALHVPPSANHSSACPLTGVRSVQHSPMSQPPHSMAMPHPGLARSWAAPQQPQLHQQPFVPIGHPTHQPPAFPSPQQPFGAAAMSSPQPHGGPLPSPPPIFSAAAAAASMCPSLQPQFQQPDPHHYLAPMHEAMHAAHSHALPQQLHAHMSPVWGPQPTAAPASWEALPPSRGFGGDPSHYFGINRLLSELHSERVNAGVRRRWTEEVDDDDDDDL